MLAFYDKNRSRFLGLILALHFFVAPELPSTSGFSIVWTTEYQELFAGSRKFLAVAPYHALHLHFHLRLVPYMLVAENAAVGAYYAVSWRLR